VLAPWYKSLTVSMASVEYPRSYKLVSNILVSYLYRHYVANYVVNVGFAQIKYTSTNKHMCKD
jgi:hypothetical protein